MPGSRTYAKSNERMFRSYIESTGQSIESGLSNLISKNADVRLDDKIEYACARALGSKKKPSKGRMAEESRTLKLSLARQGNVSIPELEAHAHRQLE